MQSISRITVTYAPDHLELGKQAWGKGDFEDAKYCFSQAFRYAKDKDSIIQSIASFAATSTASNPNQAWELLEAFALMDVQKAADQLKILNQISLRKGGR